MRKMLPLVVILAAVMMVGCDEDKSVLSNEQTSTAQLASTAEATDTPDPSVVPPYQAVRDAIDTGTAGRLAGSKISGWHAWVIWKAKDQADTLNMVQPYQLEATTYNPYTEELLPNRPRYPNPPTDPTIEAIDLKIEQRHEGITIKPYMVPESLYETLHYGQEVVISGTVSANDGGNILILRDYLIVPAADPQPAPTPVVQDLSSLVITLVRSECYGLCPAYSLTITGDGTVTYEGRAYVATCGAQTSTISQAQALELIRAFQRADYFSMRDNYIEIYYNDSPYYYTSFTLDGQSKTIEHYTGDISTPTKLEILEDRIDEIVNSSQWVGRVSQDSCSEGPSASPTP